MEREQNMSMHRLVSFASIRRFLRAQEGATAIEYAMIASGIAVAIAGTVMSLGSALKANFYDKLAAMF